MSIAVLKGFSLWHAIGLSATIHVALLATLTGDVFGKRHIVTPASLIRVGYIKGDEREPGPSPTVESLAAVTNDAVTDLISVPAPTPAVSQRKKARSQVSKKLLARPVAEIAEKEVAATNERAVMTQGVVAPSTQNTGVAGVGLNGGRGIIGGRGEGRGMFGPGDAPVSVLSAPKPKYPELAREFGFEGRVTLEAVITEEGRVGEIKVLKSSGREDCDLSALRAVRDKWRFKPATIDGIPSQSIERITVRYSLVAD